MATRKEFSKVEGLLQNHGFELLRQRKHRVWGKDGKRFTLPTTPSDDRAWRNSLTDLKRVFEIEIKRYKPTPRIRRSKSVPENPAPLPSVVVQAHEQQRALTTEEEALLATWQRAEDKRRAKEDRLLRRWQNEEKQERENFDKWLRLRALVGVEQIAKFCNSSESTEGLADISIDALLEFCRLCFQRCCPRLDVHIYSVTEPSEKDESEKYHILEVWRVPGEQSRFVDLMRGEVFEHPPEKGTAWSNFVNYNYLYTFMSLDPQKALKTFTM